jgi:hypothetical protein
LTEFKNISQRFALEPVGIEMALEDVYKDVEFWSFRT